MATGYDYPGYKLALQTLVVSQAPDVDFDNILPSAITYASERILRELNLLNTIQTDVTVTLVANVRTAALPNSFVVINGINVLTPAGTDGTNGTRNPLTAVSMDVLNAFWPIGNSSTGVPEMFAMTDQWDIILGPPPDDAYKLETIGTYRPDDLSAANPTTFVSDRLPDLFLAASMVFFAMYMRNYASAQGQSGSDPLMSGNWEAQYQLLLKSADTEEARKHMWGASWTSHPVVPQAQPQRG